MYGGWNLGEEWSKSYKEGDFKGFTISLQIYTKMI